MKMRMTIEQVGDVLAAAAQFDSRKVEKDDIAAWAMTIGDLHPADAMAAVFEHYRRSKERLMPFHLREIAKEIRRERAAREPHEVRALPSPREPDMERTVRNTRGASSARRALAALMEGIRARHDAGQTSADQAMARLRELTPGPDWLNADDTTDTEPGEN